jgi:hypothetical protein
VGKDTQPTGEGEGKQARGSRGGKEIGEETGKPTVPPKGRGGAPPADSGECRGAG